MIQALPMMSSRGTNPIPGMVFGIGDHAEPEP